jgi:hypothetical protein
MVSNTGVDALGRSWAVSAAEIDVIRKKSGTYYFDSIVVGRRVNEVHIDVHVHV